MNPSIEEAIQGHGLILKAYEECQRKLYYTVSPTANTTELLQLQVEFLRLQEETRLSWIKLTEFSHLLMPTRI